MDITKNFIKAKKPCAEGFRWYVRNARHDSTYQELLDTLVEAGRVGDARWLLAQFGPTDAVLALDEVEAEAIVFAGTMEVRGNVDVSAVLCAGRSIHAGGSRWGIRAGGAIRASGAIRAGESLYAGEEISAGSGYGIYAGLNIQADAWEACASVRAATRPADLRSGWWAGPDPAAAAEP